MLRSLFLRLSTNSTSSSKSSDFTMIEASFGNEENEDNVQEEVEECDEVDIAVTMDVSGKLVAENALNIFMLHWENLKYVRDLSFDEDCELKFPSLNKSDSFYGLLPDYCKDMFEVCCNIFMHVIFLYLSNLNNNQ